MWEAVRMKREKKSRMVTVDLCCKLQAEKCLEHGDEVDWKAIKNPKSKRDKHDAAFVAGPSKRGSGGLKKSKKDVKCWDCHKKGHTKAECWAAGGGAEGKRPKKWKGKQKETMAKTEVKNDEEDADVVWMVSTDENMKAWLAEFREDEYEIWDEQESAGESWEDDIFSCEGKTNSMPNLVSVNSPLTSFDDPSSESDIPELTLEVDATTEGYWTNAGDVSEDLDDDVPDLMLVSDSSDEGSEMPDRILVSDSSEGSSDSENHNSVDEIGDSFDVPIEMVDETVDCGIKPETRTYSTAMLASIASASPNRKIKLYDSGASLHMSPYRQNFINFVRIKG
jgi:hypothetical protein